MVLKVFLSTLFLIGLLNAQCCPATQDSSPCCPTPAPNPPPPPCPTSCCPPRPLCCKPCKPPSMNCPPILPCCSPCDCIFDFYDPLVFNCWNLSVEWLYLKVQQKASTYALTPHGHHQASPASSSVSDAIGKYRNAKFNWNSGVRAGLNYKFVRDAWNLLAQYSYYGTSGTDHAFRPSDPTLYLETTHRGIALPDPSDGVDHLISKTHFNYQEINLLLSRRYLIGCQVILNFSAGGTGALIHEKWDVMGIYNVGTTPMMTNTQNHWHFDGGGIRMGLDADWHMGCGLGLYNKFSFANLAGRYTNRRSTNFTPPGLPVDGVATYNPIRQTRQKETWVVPNTQIAFGMSWNHGFESASMSLFAGLEVNTWYNLHLLHQDGTVLLPPNVNHLDIENTSPVSLWGLNLGLEFSF